MSTAQVPTVTVVIPVLGVTPLVVAVTAASSIFNTLHPQPVAKTSDSLAASWTFPALKSPLCHSLHMHTFVSAILFFKKNYTFFNATLWSCAIGFFCFLPVVEK